MADWAAMWGFWVPCRGELPAGALVGGWALCRAAARSGGVGADGVGSGPRLRQVPTSTLGDGQ